MMAVFKVLLSIVMVAIIFFDLGVGVLTLSSYIVDWIAKTPRTDENENKRIVCSYIINGFILLLISTITISMIVIPGILQFLS